MEVDRRGCMATPYGGGSVMLIKVNTPKKPHPEDCNSIARQRKGPRTRPPSREFGDGWDYYCQHNKTARR